MQQLDLRRQLTGPRAAGARLRPSHGSKRLGHASAVVTLSIYAHVFEQVDQAAAELTARAIFGP